MKIANGGQSNVVDSSGIQTTSTFNIARTPHMFRMMSSGLYSDKIGAVLREVGCNAMDAHIMLGSPELPFQVKLPSALDRSFYVKDWGPGLDDRELRELYTTYGWSSKQQRDDVTGAFGLGSKSPFAYTLENEENTDGFTVESVKDGFKRIYTCYIGDDGAPAISRLHEGPADDADWQHGVKVTFPVQQKDVAEFHEKAREIYRWFKVQPEILGLDGKVEPLEFKMQSDFFALGARSDGRGSSYEAPAVIMGNVRYPINAKRLRGLTETEEALLNAGVHLWVPMGTVMMTPSREELEYTERTRKGVKEWLEKASLNVAHTVREAVTVPEPTKWAWFRKIQQYAESLPFQVSVHLDVFLASAGLDKEAIVDVMKSVREKYAALPSWVGNGLGGPRPMYMKDLETGRVLYDQLDTTADHRGHRAWLYTKSTLRDSGVARKEIVYGNLRMSADKSEPVKIAFTATAKAFFADSSLVDARVKGLIRSGKLEQVILIVPCKGTEQAFSKEVAERLTSTGDFDGLPVAGTSTLEIPAEVLEGRARRKLQREQSPRDFFAEFETKYLSLHSGKLVDVTLGDLGDSDLFYVCGQHLEDYRRERFWAGGGTECISINTGHERTSILLAMATVMGDLGLPVTGFVVVDGEAKAKRLKLAEQGFKPFLPYLREQLAVEANWTKLAAGVNRMPKVAFENMWEADDYGWLGIFGHHMVKKTPFWQAMSLNIVLTDLARETREFVGSVNAAGTDDEGMSPVQASLMKLASKVSGLDIDTSALTKRPAREFSQDFLSAHPMFEALNTNTLTSWMDAEVPNALTLFGAITNQELVAANKNAKATAPATAVA